MNINLFLFLIVSFFFFGCDSSKKHEPKWVENVVFNINDKKLSSYHILSDSSTMLRPPNDWIKVDKFDISTLNESLPNDVIPINIEDIFTSSIGSAIIISKINSDKSNFHYIPSDFLELMKSENKLDSIPNYTFMINNLLVRQYILNLRDVTIFKYFVESNNNYQLDFIFNKQEDSEQIESIESSIGSLTKKGDKQ